MALNVDQYIDFIKRAEQDQSTPEGRLARSIRVDPNWPYSAAKATQQARVNSQVGDAHVKHNRPHGKGHDSATYQTILDEWYTRAGG